MVVPIFPTRGPEKSKHFVRLLDFLRSYVYGKTTLTDTVILNHLTFPFPLNKSLCRPTLYNRPGHLYRFSTNRNRPVREYVVSVQRNPEPLCLLPWDKDPKTTRLSPPNRPGKSHPVTVLRRTKSCQRTDVSVSYGPVTGRLPEFRPFVRDVDSTEAEKDILGISMFDPSTLNGCLDRRRRKNKRTPSKFSIIHSGSTRP